MYDEKLEQLIDAALTDGELTEKEKQILFKKAEALGIDLDEFEMVLDARLVKIKKAKAEKATQAAPKSDKMGDVKKCPACGAIVQSYMGECAECGYAFENIQANLSSQKLAERLEEIEKSNTVYRGGIKNLMETNRVFQAKLEAIRSFPIPNTKADLLEFILSLGAKTSINDPLNPNATQFAEAYRTKCLECVNKAKILFPNDPMLKEAIAQFSKINTDKKNKKLLKIIIPIAVFILLCVSIAMCSHCSHNDKAAGGKKTEKEQSTTTAKDSISDESNDDNNLSSDIEMAPEEMTASAEIDKCIDDFEYFIHHDFVTLSDKCVRLYRNGNYDEASRIYEEVVDKGNEFDERLNNIDAEMSPEQEARYNKLIQTLEEME